MPNGRSGGYLLDPSEFEELLRQHEDSMEVGRTQDVPVTVSDTIRMLRKWKRGKVVIEEQDGSWYIVRLKDWIAVTEKSLFYPTLRRAHVEIYRKRIGEYHEEGGAS